MMTREQILAMEFESLKMDLITVYDQKGMRASGKFAESLEVKIAKNVGTLIGAKYSQQLETGRRAGGFPPIKAIEQWIYDKGLSSRIDDSINVSSLAFLIARKIAREGWNRGGDLELISTVVTEERIAEIIKKVGDHAVIDFTTDVISFLETLQN